MLSQAPIIPTVPVVDLERAREFYEGRLGLEPVHSDAWSVRYSCGNGTFLEVYRRSTPTRADQTTAVFVVDDIEREIADLRERGIIFEEYDLPGLKTVHGVADVGNEKAAWFKDPEGNILAVVERLREPVRQEYGAMAGAVA